VSEETDFREALRAIDLAQGFALVPVEVQGPDLARQLATWLAEHGHAAHVIEPLDDAAWERIVADLFAVDATPSDVVVVLGARQTTPGVLSALRLVNQRRDSIAKHLGCALLWCGPPDFQRLSWERAPDFWSIRSMPLRIEPRVATTSVAPLWPSAWVEDPPELLRAMLDAARDRQDAKNAARLAERLAQALLARTKLDAAEEVIAESPPTPELRLAHAIALARRGKVDDARAELAAVESGDADRDARRAVCEANLRFASDRAEAARSYEEAASKLEREGDAINAAIAIANVGVVAIAEGDFDEAAARLERARALLREAGDDRDEARVACVLGRAALAGRDSRRACEAFEDALAAFETAGDRRGECDALRGLARAYLNLGDAEKARDDATRALAIANELGDDEAVAQAEALRSLALAEIG
jgi:tetratricopeptide (TPR) repeat protein